MSLEQRSTDRFVLPDALRGFALFGILIVNLPLFRFTYDVPRAVQKTFPLASVDKMVSFLINMFFVGKFYSIFSLLFGVSFYLFLKNKPDNHTGNGLFKRRLLILAFIGLLHLLLWEGDILLLYGMLGLVLLPLNKLSTNTLLIVGVLCLISPVGWYALRMHYPHLDPSRYLYHVGYEVDALINNEAEDVLMPGRDNNPVEMVKGNIANVFYRYGYLLYTSRIWKVLGMFLLGIVVARMDIYNAVKKNKRLFWQVLVIGSIIGLPANYVLATLMQQPGYFMSTTKGLHQTIAFAVGVAPLALAYCAGFCLLFQHTLCRRCVVMFAPAGRMALTNYASQTVLCLLLFSGFGVGLHYCSLLATVLLSFLIFLVQAVVSNLWLRYFNQGPLEWIWRGFTYGTIVSTRKQDSGKPLI